MKTTEDEVRNYHSTMVEHQRRMADFDSKYAVLNQQSMLITEDGEQQFSPTVNPLSIVSSTAKDSASRPLPLDGPPRALVLNPIQEEEKSLVNNYSHFLQNDPLKPSESLCDHDTLLLLNSKQPPKTAGTAARPPVSSSTRCSQQSRSTQRAMNNSQISKRRAVNDSTHGLEKPPADSISPYTSIQARRT